MGFGLLFLGYFFMFYFPYKGLDVFPDVAGFVINVFALKKLSEYKLGFDLLKRLNYVCIALSSVLLGLQISGLFGKLGTVLTYFEPLYIAFMFVFNVFLLTSVYRIAKDTESLSVAARAQRNLVLTFIYAVIAVFNSLPPSITGGLLEKLDRYGYAIGSYILRCVWLVLNLVLLYSCYMRIVPEGTDDI